MTLRGVFNATTNGVGQGGVQAFGGGFTAYNNTGTNNITLHTLENGSGYYLEANNANDELSITGMKDINSYVPYYAPAGLVSKPSLSFQFHTDRGFYATANGVAYAESGAQYLELESASGMRLHPGIWIAWKSSGGGSTVDTGLQRSAAGIVNVSRGDSGTGSLIVNFEATGAAANTISSASTIAPTNAVSFVSGTTTIDTITAPAPITSTGGQITLIPTGAWSTSTSGNVALITVAVPNKALIMTYDHGTTKWYPSY